MPPLFLQLCDAMDVKMYSMFCYTHEILVSLHSAVVVKHITVHILAMRPQYFYQPMTILKLFEVLRLYVRTVCVFFHVTARLSACSRVSRVSVRLYFVLTHFILETPKGVLAKSADPDQMPHNVASDLGLHYFASCSTIFQQIYLN